MSSSGAFAYTDGHDDLTIPALWEIAARVEVLERDDAEEEIMSPRRPLRSVAGLLMLAQLCGCVSVEVERRIRPGDTDWIQPGQTTREEIIAQFGPPNQMLKSREDQQIGEYAVYGHPLMPYVYTQYGLSSPYQPRPRGPFPQVFRPPIETLRPHEIQFWLLYDAQGVVREFGFGSPPIESNEPMT